MSVQVGVEVEIEAVVSVQAGVEVKVGRVRVGKEVIAGAGVEVQAEATKIEIKGKRQIKKIVIRRKVKKKN